MGYGVGWGSQFQLNPANPGGHRTESITPFAGRLGLEDSQGFIQLVVDSIHAPIPDVAPAFAVLTHHLDEVEHLHQDRIAENPTRHLTELVPINHSEMVARLEMKTRKGLTPIRV